MGLSYKFPSITSATIAPNPVDMNTKFLLSVAVNEVTVTLDEEKIYSGEFYSREVE